MDANLNLMNLFKIGQTQGANGAGATGKVDFGGANKPNSIFNAAGMNGFAEDSIGDSFTRTTNKNEDAKAQTDNKAQEKTNNANNANNATNPNNAKNAKAVAGRPSAGGASNVSNFGLTKGDGANKFGMLSGANKEDDAQKATEQTGFGSLAGFKGTNYTVDKSSELQELADELGCEAQEDVVKNKLQKMDAKDLAKLDSSMLDVAEDLNLISRNDIEEKTGVTDKDLKNADKKQDKKIKFGTMTSGDMV